MIIVSGWLEVAGDQRAAYLRACRPIIEDARAAPGCVHFHLSADPVDPGRINVFEQWESAEAAQRFRDSGPPPDLPHAITGAHVEQHEVASTLLLT